MSQVRPILYLHTMNNRVNVNVNRYSLGTSDIVRGKRKTARSGNRQPRTATIAIKPIFLMIVDIVE